MKTNLKRAKRVKTLITHTHTHPFNGPFSGTTQVSQYQKGKTVKPIWILLEQERVSSSGISWAICKSAPCSRQTTTQAPHCSVFYRPDALPAADFVDDTQLDYYTHIICFIVQVYFHFK